MSNSKRTLVRLVSTAKNEKGEPTGTFHTTSVSSRPKANGSQREALKIKCYDPRAYDPKTGKRGFHVIFIQKKMSK